MKGITGGVLPEPPRPRRAHGTWQWLAHEKVGSRAASRHLRQMRTGLIARVCASCGNGRVPPDREVSVCDACLDVKWKIDGAQKVLDERPRVVIS